MPNHEGTDLWLVRTVSNLIAGPYSRDQVRNLIREKKLQLQDEVCAGNGRWIYLYQSHDIIKNFGVDLRSMESEEPTRAIETDWMDDDKTPTQISPGLPEVPELEEFEGTDTALMTSRAFRKLKLKESAPIQSNLNPHKIATPDVAGGKLEKLFLWRILTWSVLAAAVVLVTVLIQLIRR